MVLLTALALVVWIVVSLVPADQRLRLAVGIALVLLLILGLLGVIHLPGR